MEKKQIDEVLDRVRTWPEEQQQKAANLLLVLEVMDESLFPLTDEERSDLIEAVAEMERGEVATHAEVAELFRLRRA